MGWGTGKGTLLRFQLGVFIGNRGFREQDRGLRSQQKRSQTKGPGMGHRSNDDQEEREAIFNSCHELGTMKKGRVLIVIFRKPSM